MQKRLIPAANKLVDDMMKELKPKSGASITEFEVTTLFNQYTLDTVSRVSRLKYIHCAGEIPDRVNYTGYQLIFPSMCIIVIYSYY